MKQERIEILVEERSMEYFLRGLLPGILPKGYQLDVNCFIRAHEGKSHLRKELPKKARVYQNYQHQPVKLIVLHDQDSADCRQLKADLVALITNSCTLHYLVRIVCRELECWYLGDLDAVERVYPASKAAVLKEKTKYRNPDLLNGGDEMEALCKEFTKAKAAKEIPQYLDLERNKSLSFRHLLSGLQKLLSE